MQSMCVLALQGRAPHPCQLLSLDKTSASSPLLHQGPSRKTQTPVQVKAGNLWSFHSVQRQTQISTKVLIVLHLIYFLTSHQFQWELKYLNASLDLAVAHLNLPKNPHLSRRCAPQQQQLALCRYSWKKLIYAESPSPSRLRVQHPHPPSPATQVIQTEQSCGHINVPRSWYQSPVTFQHIPRGCPKHTYKNVRFSSRAPMPTQLTELSFISKLLTLISTPASCQWDNRSRSR